MFRVAFLCLLNAWSAYTIDTFPAVSDQSLSKCQSVAIEARKNERKVCVNPYRTCQEALAVWLKAFKQCEAGLGRSKEPAALLYYLGLIHSGLNLQVSKESECPGHFRFQEGSNVCVYENTHYDRLLMEFPATRYADMAAFNKAEQSYKYYECEGSMFCQTENHIHGWAALLKERPRAPFEDIVVGRISGAFEELAAMNQMSEKARHEMEKALTKINKVIESVEEKKVKH